MLEPSLDKSRVLMSSPAVPDYSLYEYHWDGPKRSHVPVWQPRQTTLVVVFEGESRHLFSTARILLYYRKESLKGVRSDAWDIQQSGSVIHSLRSQVRDPPLNAFILPTLTVAFEVAAGSKAASKSCLDTLVLRSPASIEELCRDSISVLLEHELPLTCDTLSLSLSFTHSTLLWTPLTLGGSEPSWVLPNPTFRVEYITTRFVRVLPSGTVRPRTTNGSLPTELLIKTFEDVEFQDSWQDDLLSFAQVCRTWSCAMNVLHSRLSFSDDDKWCQPRHLDVYALANALRKKPLLGHSFRHLTTNNFGSSASWQDTFNPFRCKDSVRFTAALVDLLRATKNLQCLHLGGLDPCQTDALFAALHALRDLHTFSIGQVEYWPIEWIFKHHRMEGAARLLSVVQLARCMGRWLALKSLKLHHLHGVLGIWRFALRPPACMLTQLTISHSRVGDKDLVHLFASSTKTLERVVLDRIEGITNAGLFAFLLAISQNVVYLTIQDVALPPFRQWGNLVIGRTERALDVVIEKMPRLRELRISGDVASEFMLGRRSKMFIAHNASEETQVPVVRLWTEDVPRLCGFAADGKWPGWCTPGEVPQR